MESTLSPSTALFAISKTLRKPHSSISNPTIFHLHRHLSTNPLLVQSLLHRGLSTRRLGNELRKGNVLSSLRYLCAAVPPGRFRLACISGSADSFTSAGGGGGGGGLGGGAGGGGGSESGDAKATDVSGVVDDLSALSPDVIILDVGGMTCGGCAASVKRILESQPLVSSAAVNLTTETAVVWPASESKAVPNWQRQLGEMLAKHLTSCGFESSLRGQGAEEGDIP